MIPYNVETRKIVIFYHKSPLGYKSIIDEYLDTIEQDQNFLIKVITEHYALKDKNEYLHEKCERLASELKKERSGSIVLSSDDSIGQISEVNK